MQREFHEIQVYIHKYNIFLVASGCSVQKVQANSIFLVSSYYQTASQAQNTGAYDVSEKYHRLALLEIEKIKGFPLSEKARQMSNLASVLNIQKKYKESELLLENALILLVDYPSNDKVQYSVLYGNLANAQYHLGKIDKSENNYILALDLAMKYAGPESSFVASDKAGLALIYTKQGKLDISKKYYEESLVIFDRLGGKEHPIYKRTNNEYKVLLKKIENIKLE